MAKSTKARAIVPAKRKRRKPPAKRNGRPTKLTQPVADRIAKGVSLGMTYKDAATAGGVHEDTRMPRQTRSRAQTLRCPSPSQGDASSWRKRGAAENNTIYTRFLGQLDRAAESTAIAYLENAR